MKILIPQLIKRFNPYEIIVVDDDSKDGTEKLFGAQKSPIPFEHDSNTYTEIIEHNNYREVKKHNIKIKFISRKERGIGSAIAKGYDRATGDLLLSLDADLSMDLDDIPRLISTLNKGYDIVVGSRYVAGGKNRKEAFINRTISMIGNLIFKIVFRLRIHDVSLNFRTLKSSVWNDIKNGITQEDNVFLLEMLVLTNENKYKIAEIPVIFTERIHGISKTNILKLIPHYLCFIWKYIIKKIFF